MGFELTAFVVIGIDCTGSCKSRSRNTSRTKHRGELRWSRRVSSSHSTSDSRRVTVWGHKYHLTWKSCWTPVCVNKYKNINKAWTPYTSYLLLCNLIADEYIYECLRGRLGRDRMVVGFTTTCAINAYHHKSCEFEPHSWRGVRYLCPQTVTRRLSLVEWELLTLLDHLSSPRCLVRFVFLDL
jgi:hypothetical protein